MRVTSTAVSLNVDDPEASSAFLTEHFGSGGRWPPTGSPR